MNYAWWDEVEMKGHLISKGKGMGMGENKET